MTGPEGALKELELEPFVCPSSLSATLTGFPLLRCPPSRTQVAPSLDRAALRELLLAPRMSHPSIIAVGVVLWVHVCYAAGSRT